RFFLVGVDESPWVLIFGRAIHSGIAVVDKIKVGDTDNGSRIAKFLFAHLPKRFGRSQTGIGNLADFATRRAQQTDAYTIIQTHAHRSGYALFVVGMGIASQ